MNDIQKNHYRNLTDLIVLFSAVSKNTSMKRLQMTFASRLVMFLVLIIPFLVEASQSVVATKTRTNGSYTTTPASFTITTAQEIVWKANYFGTGTEGNDYYLHRVATNLIEFPLSTNLQSGLNVGTYYLQPNTYHISINYFGMGPGNYSIAYNRTASISVTPVTPPPHNFGDLLEGSTSSPHTFTIESGGDDDDYPVTISSVTSSDVLHFPVQNAPIGQAVPPDRTFQVKFEAGTTPGPHSATITVSGTSTIGPVTATVTVSGTTTPKEPDVECTSSGTPNLGSADWYTGEVKTFNHSFRNTGNGNLILTGVSVLNDAPPGSNAFSLAEAPALDPVPPGGSRIVRIRFAPPYSGGEADYLGHLEIRSDDPDEPVKNCPFKATAHHPVPELSLLTGTINYGEVEIGYRFRQAVKIRNSGDATLTFMMSIVGSPDPDEDQFIFNLSNSSYTLSAGASTLIEFAFAPTEEKASDLSLIIHSTNDAYWNAKPEVDRTVNLEGIGVPPLPLSSMLVIDRSGSMSANAGDVPKISAARDAGKLYAEILQPQYDWLGITKYNQDSLTIVGLDRIENNRTTAIAKLNDIEVELKPLGSTAIGKGMLAGSNQFAASPSENAQAMIVLTDGKENVTPYIAEVKPNILATYPDLHIYCVGIGDPIETGAYGLEGVETFKLQQIAEQTDALFRVIQSLSGENRYALEAFYFKVFADAKGHQVVLDPLYYVLSSNQTQEVASVCIAECDREVDFLIISELLRDPKPKFHVKLKDPTGQIIGPSSTVGGVSVHVKNWENVRLIRIKFPPRSLSDSYSGIWKLLLQPIQDTQGSTRDVPEEAPMIPEPGYDPDTTAFVVAPQWNKIAFMAAVGSDYRMAASLTEGRVFVHNPIHLGAELTEAWWPAPDGVVSVDIIKPNGNIVQVSLYDDGFHDDEEAGDAEFGLDFADTGENGYYEFHFRGTGRTERGETITREVRLAKYVTDYRPPKPPGRALCTSFHVGSTFPLGVLDSLHDSNVHVRADIGYLLTDRVQLVAIVGLNQFTAESFANVEHPRWLSASLNAKVRFPAPTGTGLYYYLQAGPGYYAPKTGSNELGFNVGAGVQVPIALPFSLEAGLDYHRIMTDESTDFLTFQLGVLFR